CQRLYLHTFSTRRSSYLFPGSSLPVSHRSTSGPLYVPARESRVWGALGADEFNGSELSPASSVCLARPLCCDRQTDKLTSLPIRSEEHTSELQSRFDLVC